MFSEIRSRDECRGVFRSDFMADRAAVEHNVDLAPDHTRNGRHWLAFEGNEEDSFHRLFFGGIHSSHWKYLLSAILSFCNQKPVGVSTRDR